VGAADHADAPGVGVDGVQSDDIDHLAGTGVVRDDDHHGQGVAEGDGEARRQELERPRVVVLIRFVDAERVVQAERPGVDSGEGCHHDRDLAGAGRGKNDVAVAVGDLAGLEVLEVPAGDERLLVAEGVQLVYEVLHGRGPPERNWLAGVQEGAG
jgi:hypothetical protein